MRGIGSNKGLVELALHSFVVGIVGQGGGEVVVGDIDLVEVADT